MNSRYQLLSLEETAKQLGRRRWFVYKLLDERKLPYVVIGGRRCVLQRDLDDFVASNRVAAFGQKKTRVSFA